MRPRPPLAAGARALRGRARGAGPRPPRSRAGAIVPLDFLKRKGPDLKAAAPAQPEAVFEELTAQDYALKLHYHGKSSEGVRMKAGPKALNELPGMLAGQAISEIEIIEPLPVEFAEATPALVGPSGAMQWLNAHHDPSPIARHALLALEWIGALDLA